LEIICWEGQNVQRIEVVAPKEEEEEEEQEQEQEQEQQEEEEQEQEEEQEEEQEAEQEEEEEEEEENYISFIYFLRISEKIVTFALYIINRLAFITEFESVYSALRTESLYKLMRFVLKDLMDILCEWLFYSEKQTIRNCVRLQFFLLKWENGSLKFRMPTEKLKKKNT
jgi:flagellar motor protein MotB